MNRRTDGRTNIWTDVMIDQLGVLIDFISSAWQIWRRMLGPSFLNADPADSRLLATEAPFGPLVLQEAANEVCTSVFSCGREREVKREREKDKKKCKKERDREARRLWYILLYFFKYKKYELWASATQSWVMRDEAAVNSVKLLSFLPPPVPTGHSLLFSTAPEGNSFSSSPSNSTPDGIS